MLNKLHENLKLIKLYQFEQKFSEEVVYEA